MSRFLSILILVCSLFLQGEEKIIDGLLFNSIYDESEGRKNATSLTIPSKRTISYEKNLTIEFDAFFWRKSPFGFILSGGNDNDPNLFVLSYSDYKSKDTSYIELTYADRPSIISIPILDSDQGWGKWKNIKLFFEMENQRIGLSFQKKNIIWYKEDIPLQNKMRFDFGSTSFVVEPPRMAIKNIHINRDDRKSVVWKLDEESGEIAYPDYENGSSFLGQVTNGVWIKQLHRQLKPVLYHKLYQNNFQFMGFDHDMNQFIYLMNDSLFYFDNNKGLIVEKYSFPYLPEDNYIYKYNPIKKLIFATHGGGGGPISYLDLKNKIWEDFVEGYESDGLFFTSNFVYDYVNSDIYTLGGYGWYEQKNILQKYNGQNLSWEDIKYKTRDNNLFFPRCKAAISYDRENKQYFLYGGQGNESGKQQQGFRELNDFWVIDIENQEFNQIWEDSSKMYESIDMLQKITISSKNQKIYKILGKQPLNTKNNRLTQTGDLEILVSSFKSRSFKNFIIDSKENQNSEIQIVHFQFLDLTNELLVIYQKNNMDGKSLVFSTIKTPLIAPHKEKTNYAEFIILILVGCGIVVFLFTTSLRQEDKKTPNKNDSLLPTKTEETVLFNKRLSIKLLNNFEILNQGNNISGKDWKSKKARNLFIFIVLKGENGASIDEIHNIFWPDVNLESARNSRAVALSSIRRVISPYDNFLITKQDIIKFEDHDDIFIDYRYISKLIKFPKIENLYSLHPLQLFDSGHLLKFSNSTWVEYFRLEILDQISNYSKNLAELFIEKKQWAKVEFIGNKLLLLNAFNDDGMRYSVLANRMLNKNAFSHKVYTDFIKNYKLEIGEEYPLSYNNILSHYKME